MQIEGSFILRYRVFNLFAQVEGTMEIPILAECYGGPFRIYSTKEFPGLRPSTELTKVGTLSSNVMQLLIYITMHSIFPCLEYV